MKTITNDYKNEVKEFGRELDSIITYTIDNEEIELGVEELNSITPHYQGSILKSVMKQLDIDSNVDIPLGTEINYQFGVKVNDEYEYINFGNYIVYSSEKQEDTESYKIICYDKMLYSMVSYENMNITYPITINNYIKAICNHLGLVFANDGETFANYDKEIQTELYLDSGGNSLDYTFRDVLDELAEVTGSTICINENSDELEIRYINETSDTIDEEYLKDTNVNFGEKYGPINSIVLSRSAETDNVYIQDEESIAENGLCEIKIIDNQIMNFNDRSNYLPDLLDALGGLEYYLNDFSSTGITYYELCDRYTIQIGENEYSCIMFNDEIDVTQGLEELVYTERPEESETDYTKSDKTDQKINQTYLIVDKQNQTIESVVSNVTEQDEKISQITQTVDEINSKIQDIADITVSGETNFATFTLENVNECEPIMIKVKPISSSISYLYPRTNLYPSSNLYSTTRTIRFHNNTTNTDIDYILPDDLLYYDSTHYDEFYLDYDSQTCQITKRCQHNADGTISLLPQEQIVPYTYPTIELTDGDYTLSLLGYEYGYLFVRLMAKNIYTTQFYTKVETDSLINQKADEIELDVNQTLSNYSTTQQMNSAISIKANQIESSVAETYATKTTTNQLSTRINQTAKSISLVASDEGTSAGINIKLYNEDGTEIDSEDANITMSGKVAFTNLTDGTTTISGSNIKTGTIDASQVNVTNINANNITSGTISASKINGGTLSGQTISGGNIDLTSNHNNPNLTLTGTSFGEELSVNNVVADGLTVNCDNNNLIDLKIEKITSGQQVGYDGSLTLNSTFNDNYVYLTPDNLAFGETGTSNQSVIIDTQDNEGNIILYDNRNERLELSAPLIKFYDDNNLKSSISGSGIYYALSDGLCVYNNNGISIQHNSYGNSISYEQIYMWKGTSYTKITPENGVEHSSKEEYKKNITLHENNINLIKNANVYSYLFKEEDDNNKPHIGLIIGDKYNTPKEIINEDGDGISLYDMCGVMWGAIKEQQEQIEELKKEIKSLKGDDK